MDIKTLAALLLLLVPGLAYGQDTVRVELGEWLRVEARDSLTIMVGVAFEDTIPVQDTLPPVQDTLPPVQDTLPAHQDTLPVYQDTLPVFQDTLPPVQDTVPFEVCPEDWTCTPPDTVVTPPPDTTTTPTELPGAPGTPTFEALENGDIRVTWPPAPHATSYLYWYSGHAEGEGLTTPTNSVVLDDFSSGGFFCARGVNELGPAPGSTYRCNGYRPPVGSSGFVWPDAPSAPDSLIFTAIGEEEWQGDGYVTWWWRPEYTDIGTGWLVEVVQNGEERRYLLQLAVWGMTFFFDEPGDILLCVTSLYDPTQTPYDPYWHEANIPPSDVLPDTLAPGLERDGPVCEERSWPPA